MHYSVLVVTEERPNDHIINEALRPFRQEPEPEFMQDVDVTECALERFRAASGTMLRSPDGELHDAFSEQFFREPTVEEDRAITAIRSMDGANGDVRFQIRGWSDGGLTAKVRTIPDGWQEVPNPAGHNQTFAEFAAEYHCVPTVETEEAIDVEGEHANGHVLVDDRGEVVRVVTRINPHAHYDYSTRPGRFAGALNHLGGRDVCRRSDLNLEKALTDHAEERRKWAAGMITKFNLEDSDALYRLLVELGEAKAEWRKLKIRPATFEDLLRERGAGLLAEMHSADEYLPDVRLHASLEEWIGAVRPMAAYAVVIDGKWLQRDHTPWWRDITWDDERWSAKVWQIVSDIPADRWISVVDCHN